MRDGTFTIRRRPNYRGPDSFNFQRQSDGTETQTLSVAMSASPCFGERSADADRQCDSTANEDTSGRWQRGRPPTPMATQLTRASSDRSTWSWHAGAECRTAPISTRRPQLQRPRLVQLRCVARLRHRSAAVIYDYRQHPVNDPPVPTDDSQTTPEDTPLSGTATSSDIRRRRADVCAGRAGRHTARWCSIPNGTYTYTPNPNYNGPDSFTFTVNDGSRRHRYRQVSITVTPVNDPPVCTAAAPSDCVAVAGESSARRHQRAWRDRSGGRQRHHDQRDRHLPG